MSQVFAVLRRRGAGWDYAKDMREQRLWPEHVAFVNGLEADGVIRLGGILGDSNEVLLIMRGDSEDEVARRVAADPWPTDMLATVWIRQWDVLVGEVA